MTALDFSALAGEGATIRLATKEDIPAICDLRVAQSLEYWGVNPGQSELGHFRSETEAHLRRTLGERVMFLFVEEDGEIASMSGVEVFRSPADFRRRVRRAAHGDGGRLLHAPSSAVAGIWLHVERVAARCDARGVDAIYVETRNATMRHVAEKTGYEHASDSFRMTIEVEAD